MADPFEKVTFRGRLMDRKTQAFLEAMEDRLGYELTVIQGSYTNANPESAGTHGGGGVVDLVAWDHVRKVRAARELGAFAWYRPTLPEHWGEHIHLGIRNHGNLSGDAKDQQDDYDANPPRNGLANHAQDDTFHPDPKVTFDFEDAVAARAIPEPPPPTRVARARTALAEALHNLGECAAMLDAADPDRVVAKNQLDDVREVRGQVKEILEKLPER
jgi:hypothetical protein